MEHAKSFLMLVVAVLLALIANSYIGASRFLVAATPAAAA